MTATKIILRLCFYSCILLFLAEDSAAKPVVSSARLGEHPESTRFVLEFSEAVEYRIFTLADPFRVVIDLPEVAWNVPADRSRASKGLVSGFRFGLFQSGNSRVVIDVNVPVKVKQHFFLPAKGNKQNRFVLDLAAVPRADFDNNTTALESSNWRAVAKRIEDAAPSVSARQGERRVIVLDPGHGGVDPGAISITGTYEKRITLIFAREAKKIIEASGRYQVVLTRNSDVFVRLRDRFEVAHRNNAEMFISLHADSLENRRISGGSIYTLSNKASDKEAEALATKENKSDIIAGADLAAYTPEVSEILIDLAQGATNRESWFFAEMLTKSLSEKTKLLRNAHRFAGFAVLKSPNVPSVLVELGYLSNRTDEKNLRDPKYRHRIGKALLEAIDRYFERKTRNRKS